MYRTGGDGDQARIDELERALAEAYAEQHRAAGGGAALFARLRLRLRQVQRDLRELARVSLASAANARWRPALLVAAVTATAFIGGAVGGVVASRSSRRPQHTADIDGAVRVALEKYQAAVAVLPVPVAPPPQHPAKDQPASDEEDGPATAAASPSPAPAPAEASDDEPHHDVLTMADYEVLLAKSRQFFGAAQKADGAALVRLVHPLGLWLDDEKVRIEPDELKTCAASQRVHEIEDERVALRCADLLARYARPDYAAAAEVRIDDSGEASFANLAAGSGTYLVFTIPGVEAYQSHHLALVFRRAGETWTIAEAHYR